LNLRLRLGRNLRLLLISRLMAGMRGGGFGSAGRRAVYGLRRRASRRLRCRLLLYLLRRVRALRVRLHGRRDLPEPRGNGLCGLNVNSLGSRSGLPRHNHLLAAFALGRWALLGDGVEGT
jgi:hypothetical protein